MIQRKIQDVILSRLKQFPAVAMLGPRQAGKTTLAKTFSDIYYDLEVEQEKLRLDLQWDDIIQSESIIILDEAQNTTIGQMKMFLTRLGFDSKAVITGDITQIDLPRGKQSGLIEASRILKKVKGIGFCSFSDVDVVRHPLVQDIIRAYAKKEAKHGSAKSKSKKGKPAKK